MLVEVTATNSFGVSVTLGAAERRLVVEGETGNDKMTLKCEAKDRPGGLAEALIASIRDVTKLRGEVELGAPGSLPNDGKVIEDLRKYT